MNEHRVPSKTQWEKRRFKSILTNDAEATCCEDRGPAVAGLVMVLFVIALIFLPSGCGLSFVIGAPRALDHDDFGSSRSKIMNVIDSNSLEHDVVRKPLRTFRHHALAGPFEPALSIVAATHGSPEKPRRL